MGAGSGGAVWHRASRAGAGTARRRRGAPAPAVAFRRALRRSLVSSLLLPGGGDPETGDRRIVGGWRGRDLGRLSQVQPDDAPGRRASIPARPTTGAGGPGSRSPPASGRPDPPALG